MKICEEMQKLRNYLDEKKIEWRDDTEEYSETVKIARTHFEYNDKFVSVINGFGTYGGWYGSNYPAMTEEQNLGLLEVMIDGEEPVGWLKAEDAIKLVEETENDEKEER